MALSISRPPPSVPFASLRLGAAGKGVFALQQKLNAQGERLPVSGTFGPRTQEAVRRHQLAKGIQPANGIVGPATASSLAAARHADGFQAAPARRASVALTVPTAPAKRAPVALTIPTAPAAVARTQQARAAGVPLSTGAPRFFSTAPLPQSQPLKLGESTGYHAVRQTPDGRHLLDTSDAVRVPASAAQLKKMVEGGKWTEAWWGGSSRTEANPPRPGEISNFDFIPEVRGGVALAQLNISIRPGETTQLSDGRTVTTYEAKLNPRTGTNAGDKAGKIKDTGDLSGDMRIHVVDNKDGTSTFQLDWKGMVVEPRPGVAGGAFIDKVFNPSRHAGGLGISDALSKKFINVVGAGHNDALRPPKDARPPSGFLKMFTQLGKADQYRGSVDFKTAHPELGRVP